MDYIASWYQDYEDAVFEGGTSSKTGKPFTDYVTVESMVQCYLVNELSKTATVSTRLPTSIRKPARSR